MGRYRTLEYWNIEILEHWNIGLLEYLNIGIREYWNIGILKYWNMGFWIRPSMQRKRVVSRSIDCILSWLKTNQDFRIVEMTVAVDNVASRQTVRSATKRWNMNNLTPHESYLPIRGKPAKHETYVFELRGD